MKMFLLTLGGFILACLLAAVYCVVYVINHNKDGKNKS